MGSTSRAPRTRATAIRALRTASYGKDLVEFTKCTTIYLLRHYEIASIIKNKLQLSKQVSGVHLVMNYPGYAKWYLLCRLLSQRFHYLEMGLPVI